MLKKLVVYDIEVLRNVYICCVKTLDGKYIVFEISKRRNDLELLYKFFTSGEYMFVGYNCIHYDTPVVNYIIQNINTLRYATVGDITRKLKDLSDSIIHDDTSISWSKYKYCDYFGQIDLMTLLASKALRVGLKSTQVTMCYKNVDEMTVDWDADLPEEHIDNLISYCYNDIDSTSYLLTFVKSDLALRKYITSEFNIQNCISKDGVGVGVDVFTKYICEYLNLRDPKDLSLYRRNLPIIKVKDYIVPVIEFKTKPLQNVLRTYQAMVLDSAGMLNGKSPSVDVVVNGMRHSCGIGGIHSVNKPEWLKPDPRFIYRDKDVTSFYPSLADKWGFGPSGFLEEFLSVLRFMKAARVVAKNAGDKTKDSTFKLALNSILGNLRNEYSPYYAPEANVAICINGQLMLLMLIEECELNGIRCISSNTDGATFKIPVEKEELFEKICSEWEVKTRMGLEAVDYESMVILAVNDYIAFKKGYSDVTNELDFELPELSVECLLNQPKLPKESKAHLKNKYVKEKGFFLTHSRVGKGMDCLIIPKALQNYFGKGIRIEDTIMDFRSVYDYIKFEKVGKQFDVFWNGEKQQHINRFYMSKKAPFLKKGKLVVTEAPKYKREYTYSEIQKGFGVQLSNTITDPNDASLYDINYRYYIAKCNEVIRLLEPEQLTLF